MRPWIYNHTELTEPPEDAVGFVYLITNLVTGRMYIGKKNFFSRTSKRKPGASRRSWTTKQSDWRKYFSSSAELKEQVKEYGVENFAREILHICRTKREMSYLETKEQFVREVLEVKLEDGSRAFINSNIAGRWFA